ncbi:MAG: MoxR family ATPase [SAR324 cluster bacterium]|nr:MoxR family ATPase [SAR324 cluster bacterium]
MQEDIKALEAKIKEESAKLYLLKTELQKGVIGQEDMIEGLIIALLTGGHILLEGLPGLAKTRAITRLADAVALNFSRVQFTPDMLPADLIGTSIFHPKEGTFSPEKGPLFAHLVLADEINRAPAKVQSALLEVMAEKQITLAKETYQLEPPFLVLATQNPIEQEGTYSLPEAQIDRFMMKIQVGYPTKAEERKVLDLVTSFKKDGPAAQVLSREDLLYMSDLTDQIYVDPKIKDYVLELVDATRNPKDHNLDHLSSLLEFGASPRAGITLIIAAKAKAFIKGQGYVTPELIRQMAPAVLRHRILLSYEAEAEGKTPDWVISEILNQVPIP